jgi:hypothetical protein
MVKLRIGRNSNIIKKNYQNFWQKHVLFKKKCLVEFFSLDIDLKIEMQSEILIEEAVKTSKIEGVELKFFMLLYCSKIRDRARRRHKI